MAQGAPRHPRRGRLALALLLILLSSSVCCAKSSDPSAASGPASLPHLIAASTLLTNHSDSSLQLLDLIALVPRTVLTQKLRYVPELQHAHTGRFVGELLRTYHTLGQGNFGSWIKRSSSFLDAYAAGTWAPQYVGQSDGHPSTAVLQRRQGAAAMSLNNTAYSGLPVVRRVLLAQLLKAWLTTLGGRLPEEHLEQLGELVRKLYAIHHDSVVSRAVMDYFHISKSGGTSWNAAAKANGCQVPLKTPGCHVRGFGDECRWIDPKYYAEISGGRRILWGRWGMVQRNAQYRGCRERYWQVVSQGYSYVSNEYTLQGGLHDMYDTHFCPQFVNVVTMRDPLARLVSAVKFIMLNVKAYWRRRADDPEADRRPGEEAFSRLFCNATAAFWEKLGPPIADNYNVRSFLGEKGFHTPLHGLASEHVALARALLLQFDLVLDLDAGNEASDRLMDMGVGWPATLSHAHVLNSNLLSHKMHLNFSECQPAELQQLFDKQQPDLELYRFAKLLNQLDLLFMDMARALGMAPQHPNGTLTRDSKPEDISCGLLWRRSSDSSLARARRQVEGAEGGGGGAAGAASGASFNATVPDGGGGAGGEEGASYADPRDGQAAAEVDAERQAELARMQQDMDAAAAAGAAAGAEGQQQDGHSREGEGEEEEAGGQVAGGEGGLRASSKGGAAAGGDVVIGDQDEEGGGEEGLAEAQGSEVEVEMKENEEQGDSTGGPSGAELAGTGASNSVAGAADAPPEGGTAANGTAAVSDGAAQSRRRGVARLLGESLWGAREARGWGLWRQAPGERGASRGLGGGGDTGLDGAAYPEDLWRLLEEQERAGGAGHADARG